MQPAHRLTEYSRCGAQTKHTLTVRSPSWSPLLKVHAVDLLAMGAIVVADRFSGLGGTVLGLELVALATQQATTPED